MQDMHEKTLLNNAELARKSEGQAGELQAELKQRSFELSHFKMVVAEKEALLQRTAMQVDLMQDKLQVWGGGGGALTIHSFRHSHSRVT